MPGANTLTSHVSGKMEDLQAKEDKKVPIKGSEKASQTEVKVAWYSR